MLRILRNYIFWTYPRGSFHYDVMVTLILVFLFASPHWINYKDKPVYAYPLHRNSVLVTSEGGNSFVYQMSADEMDGKIGEEAQRAAILRVIEPISGEVTLDRYEAVRDAKGNVTAYRAWVRH
ncbi:MAG: hypothetical protein ACYCSN_08250 [Acidobacteriaceae bacterium]